MDEAREGTRLAFFLTGGISGRRGGGAQEERGVEEYCRRSEIRRRPGAGGAAPRTPSAAGGAAVRRRRLAGRAATTLCGGRSDGGPGGSGSREEQRRPSAGGAVKIDFAMDGVEKNTRRTMRGRTCSWNAVSAMNHRYFTNPAIPVSDTCVSDTSILRYSDTLSILPLCRFLNSRIAVPVSRIGDT